MNVLECSNKLQDFFLENAEKISKEVGFERRISCRMCGVIFIKTLVFGFMSNTKASLENLCNISCPEVAITKQGLHKRFNEKAVLFMQRMASHGLSLFKSNNRVEIELLKPFKEVKIIDSSVITLPASMETVYEGCGGSGSKASLKLQTLYNYIREQVGDIEITPGNENDQGYVSHLDKIEPLDLLLQDLGYFAVKSFKVIAEKGAFFISRLLTSTCIYKEDGVKINLLELFCETKSELIDTNILLGSTEKLAVRMVASRVPENIAAERRRKAKANAKRKGRTLSQASLDALDWGVYITNIPKETLSTQQVILIYRVRWKIELLFKLYKSEVDIDAIRGKLKPRIMCEIYAKLIGIIIFHCFTSSIVTSLKHELSFTKAMQLFKSQAEKLMRSLHSIDLIKKLLKELLNKWSKFAMKDKKRKTRISLRNSLICKKIWQLG